MKPQLRSLTPSKPEPLFVVAAWHVPVGILCLLLCAACLKLYRVGTSKPVDHTPQRMERLELRAKKFSRVVTPVEDQSHVIADLERRCYLLSRELAANEEHDRLKAALGDSVSADLRPTP